MAAVGEFCTRLQQGVGWASWDDGSRFNRPSRKSAGDQQISDATKLVISRKSAGDQLVISLDSDPPRAYPGGPLLQQSW